MPKKTVALIVDKGNEYVIQVKGNQKNLLKAVKTYTSENVPTDTYHRAETNRGRKENRDVQIFNNVTGHVFQDWKGLNTLISVNHWGTRNKKEYYEQHWYISSRKDSTAQTFADGIRGHWHIENKLHWVKDKILNEDKSMVKGNSLARNLSMIRTLVMNAYRLNKEPSIKHAIEKFSNRLPVCIELLIIKKSYICKNKK